MNICTFTGRLAKDSEVRSTTGGTAVCNFTVAVDYGYGEHKGTNWMRCSLFGKRAEGKLPEYLKKGTQVGISGELRISQYEDKEGVSKTSVDVSVEKIDLLGQPKSQEEEGVPVAETPKSKPAKKAPKKKVVEEAVEAEEDDDDIPF